VDGKLTVERTRVKPSTRWDAAISAPDAVTSVLTTSLALETRGR